MTNADIMNAANMRGLTIAGIKVSVTGSSLEFARVSIADPKHPLFGWSTEYSWKTIQHVTENGGVLR